MDERTRERHAGFATVQRDLARLLQKVANYIGTQCPVR
jgi:hypothetical protein